MHFFIPGTHPELSKAEIRALDPSVSFSVATDHILVGEFSHPFGETCNASAGIVKAGVVFGSVETYDKATIASILAATIEPKEGKHYIGVSAAVVVQKNHLLERGAEFVLIVTPDNILLGETTFVQDFEAWGHRDYGRPARDAKSGMLPPKLARLMINLTGLDPRSSALWDPFCGSGTILMEASLLGWKHVVGSDLSEKAVHDTKKNLRWALGESVPDVFVHDATTPLHEPRVFDAMVWEGALGKPKMKRGVDQKEVQQLTDLYTRAFQNLPQYLTGDGVMVCAIPFFPGKTNRFLNITLPQSLVISPFGDHPSRNMSPRGGLLYMRPHQFVGREIVRMHKV
ncbi:MAG: hypothetical protein UY95_C0010G0006 [Parcubacteria group bacterium GW2011_GWA2_56_7]|nr:MAG: hypothetical protein UY95_C0010G0006 [Parcubacteria group bacterium GW2011_GWA2_56_7]